MSDPKDPKPSTPASSSPFAALAGMRDQLPQGPTPVEGTTRATKVKRTFGEKVVVRFTRKGHGGKTVTVVTGVLPHAVDELCTEMKKALGVGARVEDGAVVLQGDLVDRACTFLEKKGAAKIVRGS